MITTDRIARGYDRLAPTYDAMLAENPVAVWMREQLWEHYARVFASNARLLDFTAGTGADVLFLAARGAEVVALDVSPGMITEMKWHAVERELAIDARVLAAENLNQLDVYEFDGALSGFAGVNTIQDLASLSTSLAQRLKPQGRVILHGLNAFCLWETLIQIGRGHLPAARTTTTQIGDEKIAHRFYDPFTLYRQAFEREFALRETYGLSVLAAPTWVKRASTWASFFFKVDRVLGHLTPNAGDFFVMDLEKR